MKHRHESMEGRSVKKILLIVTAVLVLGAAAAAGWFYLNGQSQKQPEKPVTAEEREKQKACVDDVQNDDAQIKACSDLSNYYMNSGDKQKAVESAQTAVDVKPTAETYALLAAAAESAGDIDAAIAAYEKAAAMSPKTSLNDARSDYSYYTGQAERLRNQT